MMDKHPIQGGVEILLVQKPEISSALHGTLGLNVEFTFPFYTFHVFL